MENKKGCAIVILFYQQYRAFFRDKQFLCLVIYITQLTLQELPVHIELLSKAITAAMTVLSFSTV